MERHDDEREHDEHPEFEPPERPLFLHPQWMIGIVVIFAMIAFIAGLDNPIWWLVGSPFFLVFVLLIWVRLRLRKNSD